MSRQRRLENAAAALEDFSLDPFDGMPDLCESADLFFDWTDELCDAAAKPESVVAVNQALVLLVNRYFTWRDSLPKRHRSKSGRLKHACVDEVFEIAYRRLRKIELTLSPPPLAVPPRPVLPPIRGEPKERVDGILVGRTDPDPEFDGG
jgi:hypothetical protein